MTPSAKRPVGRPPRLRRTASGANPAETRCFLASNCEDAADRQGDRYAPVPFRIGRVDQFWQADH